MVQARPALVTVLDGVELIDSEGELTPGQLEVSKDSFEFHGEGIDLSLTGIREITTEGDAVIVSAEGADPVFLSDERERSRKRKNRAQAFADELRELVGLPRDPTRPVRVRGLAWGVVGAGVLGGYLAGAALGGSGMFVTDFLEASVKGGWAALGALAIAFVMGTRARVPGLIRWPLALAAIAAGGLEGWAAAPQIADPGPDDFHSVVGTAPGIVGLILLGVALVTAIGLSFVRFPPPRPTGKPPALGRLINRVLARIR